MATETAFSLDTYLAGIAAALDVELLIGAQHLPGRDVIPRVVWVPWEDEFEPSWQRENERKVLMDAWVGFEIHVAHNTYDEARDLRRALIVALCESASTPMVRIEGGFWLRREQATWLTDGVCYVLRAAIRETVWAQADETVAIDTTELVARTDSASGDNNLDFGEP